MIEDRYNRQELIEGWDQKKLAQARVEIIGSGKLAQFAATSLVALGVGYVGINDDAEVGEGDGFLTRSAAPGKKRVGILEERLAELNPETRVVGNYAPSDIALSVIASRSTDVLLDLTNSLESKKKVLNHALMFQVPVISASTDKTGGEMHFLRPNEKNEEASLDIYEGLEQGETTSEILGGMIAEEVRKRVMPFGAEDVPVKKLAYTTTADRRFTDEADFEPEPIEGLDKKKVLIVGAGALGNFVALGAALEGVGEIDIMDFDEVESHNLNRQILFYDAVGKKKSEALAEKIREINPDIKVNSLDAKLDEDTTYFDESKPDLILDCVDSFATRAIINHYAVKHEIPLVSGGTNSESGQTVVYVPGESACLDCKLGVEQALGMKLQGAKCTDAPEPSVIISNQVVGGMMVSESLKVLDRGYGTPVTRILKYDSTAPVRGGLVGPANACGCEMPDTKEWIAEVKERFSFGGNDE